MVDRLQKVGAKPARFRPRNAAPWAFLRLMLDYLCPGCWVRLEGLVSRRAAHASHFARFSGNRSTIPLPHASNESNAALRSRRAQVKLESQALEIPDLQSGSKPMKNTNHPKIKANKLCQIGCLTKSKATSFLPSSSARWRGARPNDS